MLFSKGAEAEIISCRFLGRDALCKRRNRKSYRVHALDLQIRESRTRKEAKILHSLKLAGIRCPLVFHADLLKKEIIMEKIEGTRLLDSLKESTPAKRRKLLLSSGRILATMHSANIIHGDFTPANILVEENGKLAIIDFGLSEVSNSTEEKATDLLIFKKSVPEKDFKIFLEGYKSASRKFPETARRLSEIEKRGRYVVRAQAN